MSNIPPQTLKGFRDFLPAEKQKRDFIEQKMRTVFERFGFAPLETPTLEYASLLKGKYGEEADKLIYSFQDRGDREIGLRYDQTVPTSRVLFQYQSELPKFFRRYQIQNVFRADKPQKGRYREFKQCDCDVFGSTSPLADAEILAVCYSVYQEIGLTSVIFEVNDRQTLVSTLSPFATPEVTVYSIIQSIDKLDKMEPAEVVAELVAKGLTKTTAEAVLEKLNSTEMPSNLREIVDNAVALGIPKEALKFNPKLARGLDYYTGLIFEGKVPEYGNSSVVGGGRYDNLIKDLSGLQMPATGFAIGFDRTVEVAEQMGVISVLGASAKVLVTLFDQNFMERSLQIARALRQAGIATEVYPELDKLGKQFKLADQKRIPYVIILGEEEAAAGTVTLKDMATGEQQQYSLEQAIENMLR